MRRILLIATAILAVSVFSTNCFASDGGQSTAAPSPTVARNAVATPSATPAPPQQAVGATPVQPAAPKAPAQAQVANSPKVRVKHVAPKAAAVSKQGTFRKMTPPRGSSLKRPAPRGVPASPAQIHPAARVLPKAKPAGTASQVTQAKPSAVKGIQHGPAVPVKGAVKAAPAPRRTVKQPVPATRVQVLGAHTKARSTNKRHLLQRNVRPVRPGPVARPAMRRVPVPAAKPSAKGVPVNMAKPRIKSIAVPTKAAPTVAPLQQPAPTRPQPAVQKAGRAKPAVPNLNAPKAPVKQQPAVKGAPPKQVAVPAKKAEPRTAATGARLSKGKPAAVGQVQDDNDPCKNCPCTRPADRGVSPPSAVPPGRSVSVPPPAGQAPAKAAAKTPTQPGRSSVKGKAAPQGSPPAAKVGQAKPAPAPKAVGSATQRPTPAVDAAQKGAAPQTARPASTVAPPVPAPAGKAAAQVKPAPASKPVKWQNAPAAAGQPPASVQAPPAKGAQDRHPK